MKFHPKYFLFLLVIPAIMACNLSSLAAGTAVPSGPSNKTSPFPTAGKVGVPLPELEGQARQVVIEFLSSLQSDPTGKKAETYLGPTLMKKVSGGEPVINLLGAENSIPKFELSAVSFSPDAAKASVDATLLYQTPLNKRFILVLDGSIWKIDDITSLEGAASYPPTPEQVVQAFLTAYQESPDQMVKYLSKMRLNELPPGGAVGMLNINGSLEGSMIDLAAVNPNPPNAAITVIMRVGGNDLTRVFTLTKENEQWKIINVDPKN